MTTQADKNKQKKKRAEKKKHEHMTEQRDMAVAKKHRSRTEEYIAIAVLLIFVPFMVIAAVYWPGGGGQGSSGHGGTGLKEGKYTAVYVSARPEGGSSTPVAVLDVQGQTVPVTQEDLIQQAADNSQAFFEGQPGSSIKITVKNYFISDFEPL
jgi:hypothetical protein